MHTPDDKTLNTLLKERSFEPPASNLAERIIAAAQALPSLSQQPRQSMWEYLIALMTPTAAMTFASTLLFGFMVGQFAPENIAPPQNTELTHMSDFLYDEEDIL